MKSILLHIYDDTGLESRLQAAFDLARCFDGHITCLQATPLKPYLVVAPVTAVAMPQEFSWKIEQNREELQSRIENRFVREGMNWDWIQADEVTSTCLVRYSLLVDVIVLNTDSSALKTPKPHPTSASVAVRVRAPVLAVPYSSEGLRLRAPVLIAWNGSPESAAAMRAALPILKVSAEVRLLEVEAKMSRYPSDIAARYLARHDIEAEILQRSPIDGSISEAIRAEAIESGAGTIVMGAYGRSRLRETLFGGVTHDLLAESPVPLLLMH